MSNIYASSALLSKIETHAVRLEAAADKMDTDGIGGHPTRGHAAVLRDMAGCMRADAARGKTPDRYDGGVMYGAADVQAGLEAIGAIHAGGSPENDRRNAVMVSEALGALRRLGVDVSPLERGEKLSAHAIDAAMYGKPIDQRIRAKSLAHNARLID
jgi:hypothetical protein